MVAAPLAMIANALPLTPGGLGVGEVAFDQVCTLGSMRHAAARVTLACSLRFGPYPW
jgi:hypothetical protein